LELVSLAVRGPDDLEGAFTTAIRRGAEALVVIQDTLTNQHRARVTQLAAKSRLPAVYGSRQFMEAGGVIAYGADLYANFRRGATFVDKILKGAKPSELPVEQPTRFELVINRKTAQLLGLTIPPSLLQRADQIID
jgi:putative ABC transport system substrate-binding protein